MTSINEISIRPTKEQTPFTFPNSDYGVVRGSQQWGAGLHHNPEIQQYRELLQEIAATIKQRDSITKNRENMVPWKPFPRYLKQRDVISYLGIEKTFWILVEEYGLKPVRQEHKCNIYCSKQVEEKCVMFELNIAA